MSRFEVPTKRNKENIQMCMQYFALKSNNEIYYQMASIFKEITNDEQKIENQFFNMFLADKQTEFM